jgi:hypothetical protein
LHTGDAVERVVGIGGVALIAAVDVVGGREDVAYGVVVVGHQNPRRAGSTGVVDGEQASVGIIGVGIGSIGIVNPG